MQDFHEEAQELGTESIITGGSICLGTGGSKALNLVGYEIMQYWQLDIDPMSICLIET